MNWHFLFDIWLTIGHCLVNLFRNAVWLTLTIHKLQRHDTLSIETTILHDNYYYYTHLQWNQEQSNIKLSSACIFVSTTRRRHDTRSVGHFGRHHHFNCTISQTLSHRIEDRLYVQIFIEMAHYIPIFVRWSRWKHSPRSIFNIKSFISFKISPSWGRTKSWTRTSNLHHNNSKSLPYTVASTRPSSSTFLPRSLQASLVLFCSV